MESKGEVVKILCDCGYLTRSYKDVIRCFHCGLLLDGRTWVDNPAIRIVPEEQNVVAARDL